MKVETFPPRIKKAMAKLGQIPAALRLVWRAVPGWTSLGLALIVVQGLLPVALVYLTKILGNKCRMLYAKKFFVHILLPNRGVVLNTETSHYNI